MSTDVSEVRNVSDEELRAMLLDVARGSTSADNFFGSFSYSRELLQGNYSSALDQGMSLLLKCQSLETDAYEEIHKGTPFYWLGVECQDIVNDFMCQDIVDTQRNYRSL